MRNIIIAMTLFLCWTNANAEDSAICTYDANNNRHCDQISCDIYVANAVEAAQKAADNRCGFSGQRWSTDPDVHRQACTGSTVDYNSNPDLFFFLVNEEQTRIRDGFTCQSCRIVTDLAMKDVATAVSMHCDFVDKSPRWQNSEAAQFGRCMQTPGGSDDLYQMQGELAACKKGNQLRSGVSQGKSFSTMRREAKEKMLEGSVRKVLPCPPELGSNCNKPQGRAVVNPGLLESDGGFARQGPAATGSPVQVPSANSYRVR